MLYVATAHSKLVTQLSKSKHAILKDSVLMNAIVTVHISKEDILKFRHKYAILIFNLVVSI